MRYAIPLFFTAALAACGQISSHTDEASTGPAGSIIISGGAAASSTRLVSLTIGATPDVTLMQISELLTFNNERWKPLASSETYTFASEGPKTLYIKFADANGLESSPFDSSIAIDLFGDSEGAFTINSGALSSLSRTVNLAIDVPQNAKSIMICEQSDFSGCSWEAPATDKSYVFDSDGTKVLHVKYKDADAFESPATSATILVDTLAPNAPISLALYSGNMKNVLNWSDGGGDSVGHLVVRRVGQAVDFIPTNGTAYTVGQALNDSQTVVKVGTDTPFTDIGLSNGIPYHYKIFSFDASLNYSSGTTGSSTANLALCGGSNDSCYNNLGAIADNLATTPSGKALEYVFADGNSGFKVWKEQGGNRILRANGLDEWAEALNLNGKGLSGVDFVDTNIGSTNTIIEGRVCPPNVYIDDSNKFSTNNCVYYTPRYAAQRLDAAGTSQTLSGSIGLSSWSTPRWYVGNIETCSSKGMRLPALFELALESSGSCGSLAPQSDGTPIFAESSGVPVALTAYVWSASSGTDNTGRFCASSGGGYGSNRADYSYAHVNVRCLLP